jgi:hypothetical protein
LECTGAFGRISMKSGEAKINLETKQKMLTCKGSRTQTRGMGKESSSNNPKAIAPDVLVFLGRQDTIMNII